MVALHQGLLSPSHNANPWVSVARILQSSAGPYRHGRQRVVMVSYQDDAPLHVFLALSEGWKCCPSDACNQVKCRHSPITSRPLLTSLDTTRVTGRASAGETPGPWNRAGRSSVVLQTNSSRTRHNDLSISDSNWVRLLLPSLVTKPQPCESF